MGHAGADLRDDAGAFVAQHQGQRQRKFLLHDDDVRMAHAGGDDADDHLVVARIVELQGLDRERPAGVADHGRLDFPHLLSSDPVRARRSEMNRSPASHCHFRYPDRELGRGALPASGAALASADRHDGRAR